MNVSSSEISRYPFFFFLIYLQIFSNPISHKETLRLVRWFYFFFLIWIKNYIDISFIDIYVIGIY